MLSIYIKKSLRRLIAASLIVGSMTFMPIGHAEIQTYTGVGEYIMSDFETPDIAKQRAKQYAERNAQEQAGVYVNSYTKVENMQVTEDEIITMTNGILSVTDVKTAKDEEKIKTQFEEADKVFLSNQKVQEGNEHYIFDNDLALACYNEAIELNPNNGSAYFNRASVYISFQQYSDAVNDLTKAMSLHVDSAILYNNLGHALTELGQYDRAEKYLNKAVELNPEYSEAYNNLGVLNIDRRKFDVALEYLKKAVSMNTANYTIYANLAVTYFELHDYENALSNLDMSIELNHNIPDTLRLRATCYRLFDREDLAILDEERARGLEDGSAERLPVG